MVVGAGFVFIVDAFGHAVGAVVGVLGQCGVGWVVNRKPANLHERFSALQSPLPHKDNDVNVQSRRERVSWFQWLPQSTPPSKLPNSEISRNWIRTDETGS